MGGIVTMVVIYEPDFPPSFDGSPLSYGAALFSLTLICAVSVALLMQFVFDWRARREAQKIAANEICRRVPWASPLTLHRWIITGLLTTILFGALPDVIVLMIYGETSRAVLDAWLLVDRIGDGLTIFPFLTAAMLSAWGMQVLPQQLVRETRVSLRRPRWETIKPQVKIICTVFVIAVGVTLAKAYA